MSDIVDKVTLDSEDYIRALRKIAADVDKMAAEVSRDFDEIDKKGSKAFKGVGDAADKASKKSKLSFSTLSTAIGGVLGAVTAVTAVAAAFAMADEAIAGVRIRRSFEQLAAGAGTTGQAILDSIQQASAFTIDEMKAMELANLSLQLRVAKTPAEFEKLTKSAILLGRALGKGPVEALNDLAVSAGRRSTEILDNLGLSLADVNARMESLAQQQFGKTTEQLDQVSRNALFMAATLEEAGAKSAVFGDSVEDIGTRAEAVKAQFKNLQQDVGESFALLTDRALLAAEGVYGAWLGPDGVFAGFAQAGTSVQEIFAAIVAAFFTAAGTIARRVVDLRKVLTGQLGIGEFLSPGRIAEQIQADYAAAFGKITTDFQDIFDPAAAARGTTPPVLPPPEVVDEEADKLAEKVKAAQERLTEIERDGARDRLDNALKANRERLDAEAGFVQKRIDQARKYLQQIDDAERDLARDLDDITRDQAREQLQAERESAQARLDNELEYQRELLRIKQRFDFQLEDAARARDAVQFLQLQRQQQQELDQARTTRDQQQQDSATEAGRRREELRLNQQAEIDDANLANQRKLEDLRLANQREVEELGIAEERKRAELQLANERRLADLKTAYDRQLADFRASLDAEVAALLEAESRKTEIVKEAVARRAALDRRQQARIEEQVSQGRTVIAGRASGGPVAAGRPYLIGEAGPEIMVPQNSGYVIPNTSPLMMNTLPSSSVINNVSQDRVLNNNMGIIDPQSLDVFMRIRLEMMLGDILSRVL